MHNLTSNLALKLFLTLSLIAGITYSAISQSGVYVDPNKSNRQWRSTFNVAGNEVESIITNYGTIGRGNESINQAGVWPRGTGHGHLHEMTGWIASNVRYPSGQTQVMVSDGYRD